MGKEFVTGYHSVADGEKDPRNLLLAFSIGRVVLIEFDISSHVAVSSRPPVRNGGLTWSHAVFFRHHFLLFPNHIQTTTGRPIWHHARTTQGGTPVRTLRWFYSPLGT